MKYQAVVFDLYGTLIEDQLRKGRDALLVQMAAVLSLPADDFAAAWEQTGDQRTTGGFDTLEECVAHICQALGARPDAERIEAAVELRVGYIRARLRPRDDAVETLTRLKSLGRKTALISDCGLEVPMLWSETLFFSLFDTVLFSSREGRRKPDPVLYRRACERLGVEPGGCLYVGDGNSRELSGAESYDYGALEAGGWRGERIGALREIMELVN